MIREEPKEPNTGVCLEAVEPAEPVGCNQGAPPPPPLACDGFERLIEIDFVSEKASGDGVRREWLNLVAGMLCDPTRGVVDLDGEGSICLQGGGVAS